MNPEQKARKRIQNKQPKEETCRANDKFEKTFKKKKTKDDNFQCTKEHKEKILDMVTHQINQRKLCNEQLSNGLSEIFKTDEEHSAIKENMEKLEHLTSCYMTSIQEYTIAYKHDLDILNEIHALDNDKHEKMEDEYKFEIDALLDELDDDIKKLKDKLRIECKRSTWGTLGRTIFEAIQNF